MNYKVKDLGLAKEGKRLIEWAEREMPVLLSVRKDFSKGKPLKGLSIGACLHITSETANLALTLKKGGAEVFLCASNPLSTQDSVAASLVKDFGIFVFGKRGENNKEYYSHIESVLKKRPQILLDDGADLISTAHQKGKEFCKKIIGGTEETTTGVIRFQNLEKEKKMLFPIIAVNNAFTKHLFDNRYGTGQSTIDGLLRATNILLAGKKFVVAGYGWCGRGIAMRAKGMGATVIITEVDALRALEATMDGFWVMNSKSAAKIGDIFITATGDCQIFTTEHFKAMKDGAILGNSGHFNVEIDIPSLRKMSKQVRKVRENVSEYRLSDGRRIYLLAEGRLLNLSAAEGHPSAVMDMSFSNQALSVLYLTKERKRLKPALYSVPSEIDREVAKRKLSSLDIKIDSLSSIQKKYLSSWQSGT